MHVLFGCLLVLAQLSGDPRTISPAANRPEIVAPGGGPAAVTTPKTRPPKTRPPKIEPEPEPEPEPKIEPEPEPQSQVEPQPQVEPKRKPQTPAPVDQCFPARGRCRRLNVAGIIASSTGVVMLGTGVGFMLAPEFPIPDEPVFNRSLRSPGVVLVAAGAATTVAGVIMIIAGHAIHRKPPRSATARVRLTPGGIQW